MKPLLQPHRTERRRLHMVGVLAVVLLLIFFSTTSGARVLWLGLDPLVAFIGSAGRINKEQTMTREGLIEEIMALREELARMETERLSFDALRAENAELRSQARYVGTTTSLVAPIIRRPRDTLYDTFLVGAGRRDGVVVGDRVQFGGVLLGEIASVRERTATALLSTSPSEEIRALVVVGASTHAVVAVGQGGGFYRGYVSRMVPVYEGMPVYIPLEGLLLIGTIVAISSDETEALREVLVAPPVAYDTILTVRIVPALSRGTP